MTLVRYPHSIEAIFNTDFGGNGVTFDGSTNYIVYNIPNALLAKPKLTFVVEFYPDFNWDVNNYYTWFSSTGDDYQVYKANSAFGHVLAILVGNVAIAYITSATYSPYWLTGERNILVVSAQSGSTNAWLNGNQILTNDNSTYSHTYPTELYLGCFANGTFKFDGRIKHFSIHNRLFTQSDVTALQNNSLYNFENKSLLYLDMKTSTTLDGLAVTLDKSKYGRNYTLGNGLGSGAPDFLAPGFDCGANEYLLNVDSVSWVGDYSELSFVCMVDKTYTPGSSFDYVWFDSANKYTFGTTNTGNMYIRMGGTSISTASPSAAFSSVFNNSKVIAFTSKSGASNVYLDGELVDSYATAWSPTAPTTLSVCGQGADAPGRYKHFSVYPFVLSPIQVRYLSSQLLGEYH